MTSEMSFKTVKKTFIGKHLAYSIFFLLIGFYLSVETASSAQLINQLPAELKHNWQICEYYSDTPPECNESSLPLKTQAYPRPLLYQTFSKEIVLSSDLNLENIALWLPVVDDTDEVYFNNQLIGKTGRFLPNFDSGFRFERLYQIPTSLIYFNQFNRLEIRTFSSRQQPGIQSNPPVIGDYTELYSHIKNLDQVYIVAASLLLLLALFQAFYFLVVKGNHDTILLGWFLVSCSLVTIARSFASLEMGLELSAAFKIELFMLNMAVIGFSLFIFQFFELELRKFYITCLAVVGLSALIIVVWPINVSLRQIAQYNYWLLILSGFLVVGSACIIAIHKQRKYAWLATLCCSFIWLMLIVDSLMVSPGIVEAQPAIFHVLLPVSAVIFGTVFSFIITHKFWRFFKGSTYDHLTGTLLRPAFFQRLSEEMQRSQRSQNKLLISVIDIQQAKKISANYGYSVGNHLLATVSNTLTKVLRPFDLICRFSDEQFCVAATIEGRKDAESFLKKIYMELITIDQAIDKDIELYIDARIGGIMYNPDHHLSVSHLVQDANYALSKAKSQSKTNYLLLHNPTISA